MVIQNPRAVDESQGPDSQREGATPKEVREGFGFKSGADREKGRRASSLEGSWLDEGRLPGGGLTPLGLSGPAPTCSHVAPAAHWGLMSVWCGDHRAGCDASNAEAEI